MSHDDELMAAVDETSGALHKIVRVAEHFARHIRDEEARIKRRLERLDAREERIVSLGSSLKERAKELYTNADEKGLTDEDRYRLIGEAIGLEKAMRAIEETNI